MEMAMKKSLTSIWKLVKKIHPASMDILMTKDMAEKKGLDWDPKKRSYAKPKSPAR